MISSKHRYTIAWIIPIFLNLAFTFKHDCYGDNEHDPVSLFGTSEFTAFNQELLANIPKCIEKFCNSEVGYMTKQLANVCQDNDINPIISQEIIVKKGIDYCKNEIKSLTDKLAELQKAYPLLAKQLDFFNQQTAQMTQSYKDLNDPAKNHGETVDVLKGRLQEVTRSLTNAQENLNNTQRNLNASLNEIQQKITIGSQVLSKTKALVQQQMQAYQQCQNSLDKNNKSINELRLKLGNISNGPSCTYQVANAQQFFVETNRNNAQNLNSLQATYTQAQTDLKKAKAQCQQQITQTNQLCKQQADALQRQIDAASPPSKHSATQGVN